MWKDSKKFPVTPQRTRSAPCTPMKPPSSEKKQPLTTTDSLNSVHKVPAGDSPYVKAKHVQLIDRDPSKAIALFWSAINSGDRVDSALKDMAVIMKQLNRTDEGIEAIKSFRSLCSQQAQESLDNVLIDLYKRGGRMDEHIELLQHKLLLVEEGVGFGGKRIKIARSQGKKFHISIEQEKSRLLGNLAWAYMQQNNYQVAEKLYRQALCLEPDKNKQCNLAICLMHKGRIKEAKFLLQSVTPSSAEREIADSYIKSFDRAMEMLTEIESSESVLNSNEQKEEKSKEIRRPFTSPGNMTSKPHVSSINENQQNYSDEPKEEKAKEIPRPFTSPGNMTSKPHVSSFNENQQNCGWGFSPSRRWREDADKELFVLEEFSVDGYKKWKQEPYGGNQFEYKTDLSDFDKRRPSKNLNTGNGEIFASPVSSKLQSTEPENVSHVSGPLFGDKLKKGYLSQNTFQKGSDLSHFDERRPSFPTANGENFSSPVSSNLESTEQGNGSQFSCPQFGGKWKKEYLSPNTFRRGPDFSAFRKGSMCENGSNEGSASNNMMTANGEILFGSFVPSKLDKGSESKNMNAANGEIVFGSLVSSKLESTGPQNDSRFSINRRRMRLSGNDSDKKQQVINGNVNPKLPYLSNEDREESSKLTVSGSRSETVVRKCTQERLNETDSFGVKWKCFNVSNEDQDQGSKVTVSGSKTDTDRRKNNQEQVNDSDSIFGNWKPFNFTPFKSEKSWADMVEEEEALSGNTDFPANEEDYPSEDSSFSYPTPTKSVDKWDEREAFQNENLNYPSQRSSHCFRTPAKLVDRWNDKEAFHDESLNSNIISHQSSNGQTENLRRKLEAAHLKGDGYPRSTDTYMFRKPMARRSLYFEQKQKQGPADYFYTDSNTTHWKDSNPVRRGNRLQVFQEVTLPESLIA